MPLPPITILPSLPAEGWVSMNRYWDAINRCIEARSADEFVFRCPLEYEGVLSKQRGKLALAWQKTVAYPRKVRRTANPGVAHILDHSYAFLLGSIPKGVKTMVTVHDLLPLRAPENLGEASIARFRQRVEWVKKADVIVSVSNHTKQELVDLINVDPDQIRVIPEGADGIRSETTVEALPAQITGPYIFSIGGFLQRKNLEILPSILETIRSRHPGVTLVRAGAPFPESLRQEINARCGEGALLEMGRVSDGLLATLYSHAHATVIPSRYEGFGLPVLEAMARGCPVVCADATSLPEVGGDAALYFPVDEPDEAARQLLRILDADEANLGRLKQKGLERAQQFTWEIHFQKLLEIYRELGIASGH